MRAIRLSDFALDGGAMHGVVPKVLWSAVHAADERNRIALAARALLVDLPACGARLLVDTGLGAAWGPKQREIYAIAAPARDAPSALREAGVDPETITHVLLTHLHWDHAGGTVLRRGGELDLAFPRAEHIAGRRCLEHARRPSDKDAGSFRQADLELLAARARLRLWETGEPLVPGIEGRECSGHCPGMIVPLVRERDDGPPLAVAADLIPTRSHLRHNWVMAYDNEPLLSLREKRALLEELAAIGGGVLLYHDPEVEAAWCRSGPDGAPRLVPGRLDGTALD
ncbi:MAG: MBL fold metallo-hydrolase [Deltaproteobacteria bacterium]|nr:MBL fold metallo-hydrolase [Deltaproteobacteria bacterium]